MYYNEEKGYAISNNDGLVIYTLLFEGKKYCLSFSVEELMEFMLALDRARHIQQLDPHCVYER